MFLLGALRVFQSENAQYQIQRCMSTKNPVSDIKISQVVAKKKKKKSIFAEL